MTKIYGYQNNDGIIEDFSLTKNDASWIEFDITVNDYLKRVYDCLVYELNYRKRKFYVNYDAKDNKTNLVMAYYVYYENPNKILSISPNEIDTYSNQGDVKCGFVVDDEVVQQTLTGKLSLSRLQLKLIKKKTKKPIFNLVKLESLSFIEPRYIKTYLLDLSAINSPNSVIYNKQNNELIIKQEDGLYDFIFITQKYNPGMIYQTFFAEDIIHLDDTTVQIKMSPNLPDKFDIYSNNVDHVNGYKFEMKA